MPTDNNTPSETGPQSHGDSVGGEGIASWANALANSLNISVAEATQRIKAYMNENNASPQEAATYLANHAPTGGDGSGSGSGSGGSSGGSSSPYGSGAFGESSKAQVMANAAAGFENMLVSWGLEITPEVKGFIQKAVSTNMNTATFLKSVRATKFYAQRFAGIMKPNGTMRMTEAQYISGYQQAKDYGASIGVGLSQQVYALAVKNGNSPSEIRQRLDVLDKLKSYGPQLESFNEYLVQTGQIKKPLDRKQLAEFVMGKNKALQDQWTLANTAFNIEQTANVDVGKPATGGEIGYRELGGLLKRFQATGGDPSQIDFAQMGSLIANVVPKNDLYGAGIRKRDIVEMMLNGKNAADITKRVQTVLDTYEAAVTEPGAQSQNQQGQVYQQRQKRPLGE